MKYEIIAIQNFDYKFTRQSNDWQEITTLETEWVNQGFDVHIHYL